MSGDDVVVIAFAHIETINRDCQYCDSHNTEKLFSSLGIEGKEHRKYLFDRAKRYDHLGHLPPSLCTSLHNELGLKYRVTKPWGNTTRMRIIRVGIVYAFIQLSIFVTVTVVFYKARKTVVDDV